MNREIKFRAWDEFNKNMHYQNPSYRNSKSLYNFFNNVEGHEQGGNRMLLMQYTGLKDKNGQEIYEGDIIEINDGVDDGIYEIIYSDRWTSFELKYTGNSVGYYNIHKSKVIGNIYENPDLINND